MPWGYHAVQVEPADYGEDQAYEDLEPDHPNVWSVELRDAIIFDEFRRSAL